ncbi:MAG: hypothetical protein R3302_08320 [Sulfurimonadaceae bacterium]|nr:hypothetical protein [Sulfurimonadaceae bacterium]
MYGLLLADEAQFSIRKEENIFLIRLLGYWDLKTAKHFRERFRLLVEIAPEGEWGALADLRDWDGASEEAFIEAKKILDWMVENGQHAGVHVLNSGVRKTEIAHLQEIQRARIAFDVFHSVEVALPWLRAKLRQSAVS